MKVGTEDKKKLYIAGGLGFFALLAIYPLYQDFFGGPGTSAPPPPVIRQTTAAGNVPSGNSAGASKSVSAPPGFAVGGTAAEKVGKANGQLDPTLHMEGMLLTESLIYSGSGRNIFAAGPAEVTLLPVVQAKAPARPPTMAYTPPPAPTGPPPPPPINLKFFGTATSANGSRKAFLLNGDDVFLASAGDVVERRYRVVTIAATSIVVEDLPNSNKQTLPLIPN